MKKKLLRSALALGVISLMGSVAIAQDTSPAGANRQQPGTSQRERDPSSPGISGVHQTSPNTSSGQLLRFTQLIGANVQSSQGSTLGQVRDLAVDPQTGRIELAVLSLGSGGIGSSTTATTTSSSSTDTSRQSTTTPSTSSPDRSTTPGATATPGSTSTERSAGTAIAGSPGSQMGKLVAVPWQILRSSGPAGTGTSSSSSSSSSTTSATSSTLSGIGAPTLVLIGDESKLQSAPAFDHSSFNGMNQSTFVQRAYSHFGVNYENRGSNVGGTGTGVSTGTGSDRNQRNTPDSTVPDSTRPGNTPSSPNNPGSGTSPNPK
jgi:hypothetical protein